jgi:nucleotide sugar dehydrogenase
MIKLANNAYRDYHFAFANELAQICQVFHVDVNEVISIANQGYSRSNIPKPSPGVGGPCLTKDSHLLFSPIFSSNNVPQLDKSSSAILRARAINEVMPRKSAHKFHQDLQDLFPDTRQIHFLGLAFKGVPETNDLRNSPAMELYDYFKAEEYIVSGWDAVASEVELKNSGIRTTPYDINFKVAIILGNNNPKNLEELARLHIDSKVVSIFDPWDLIMEFSQTASFLEKGIAVSNLTTLQTGQ